MKIHLIKRDEPKILINFQIYKSDKEFIDKLSTVTGMSQSAIFRSYINELREGNIKLEL